MAGVSGEFNYIKQGKKHNLCFQKRQDPNKALNLTKHGRGS